MNSRWSLIVGGAVLALGATQALADGMSGPRLSMKDGPVAAPSRACSGERFSGFYVGGNLGGVGHNSKWEETYADFAPDYQDRPLKVTKNGVTGGVQVGHNRVHCNTLFGVEADFNLANAKHSTDHFPDPLAGAGYATISDQMRAFMTLRGRLGFVVDRTLFYATGGLAFANLKHSMRDHGHFDGSIPNPFDKDVNGWRRGWTVGAGFEHALTEMISIKAEGLYMKFKHGNYDGTDNAVPPATPDYYTFRHSNDAWTARVGLNFKLGAPPRHQEPYHEAPPPKAEKPAKVADKCASKDGSSSSSRCKPLK